MAPFQIVKDLPEDVKLPGRGNQLDQAAAFCRANADDWVTVANKGNENSARNLAAAISTGQRAAFKPTDDEVGKGYRFEGAYRPDGTVLAMFVTKDDEMVTGEGYDDEN